MRLPTAFLALAVGLVAGYLLGRGAATPARAARPPSPPGIEARPAPAAGQPVPGLAAVLESLPPLPVERGTGTITGRVLAADGSPLEGALVRASAQWPQDWRGSSLTHGEPPPERTLEELVRARIEELRRAFGNRIVTRTDAEGRYVLSGLVDTQYYVVAYLQGFALEPSGRVVKPGATLDFRASPLLDVPVVVLEPDGRMAASATVHVMSENDGHAREAAWSPAVPNLPLRSGRHTLWATAGEQYDSNQVRTTIAGDAPLAPVTMQLKVRAGILGRILVPADEAPFSLEVYVLQVKPGTRPDPKLLRSAGTSQSAWEGNQYSFSAFQLQPGTYAVGVGWSRDRIDVIEVVEAAGGDVSVDLRLPPPDPTDHMLVHVLDPDGRPVDAPSIWTTSLGRSGGYFIRRRDGSYWVAHADWQERRGARPAAAEYTIEVSAEGLGRKTVPYRPEPGAEVTVRFEAPARLEVVIEGYAGSGLEGHLALRPVRDGKTWLDSKTPDLEGRASFPLQPGAYELRLLSKLSNNQQALISATACTGENRVTLPLPALHTLTVLTRAARVNLVPADRVTGAFYGEQRPVEDGKAVFDWLPAGRYRVWGTQKPVDVEIPAQLTVRVE